MLVKISDDLAVTPESIKEVEWHPGEMPLIAGTFNNIIVRFVDGREWKLTGRSKRQFNRLVKIINESLI